MNIKILDIKIDIISKQEVLDKIKNLINSNESGKQLCTTNPEFILTAQKDDEFKNIINNSWISVADGYGIHLASKYLDLIKNKKSIITKFLIGMKIAWWGSTRNSKKLDVITDLITGTDLIPEICKQKTKIFLLGGRGDVPRLTAERLSSFVILSGGRPAESAGRPESKDPLKIGYAPFEEKNIIEKINSFKPDILFVALNHPRAQKWIDKNLANLPSVKLAMGVGGAFDYLSGKIKRAPQGMRHSFEWLFRLLCQPKRLKRIWQASVVFPWKVFIYSTRL